MIGEETNNNDHGIEIGGWREMGGIGPFNDDGRNDDGRDAALNSYSIERSLTDFYYEQMRQRQQALQYTDGVLPRNYTQLGEMGKPSTFKVTLNAAEIAYLAYLIEEDKKDTTANRSHLQKVLQTAYKELKNSEKNPVIEITCTHEGLVE